ncbi:MAG: UMP kinase, partial [Chloroflexota bacterium]
TDTAGALRALEIEADVLLMTKFGVDGIYDADPRRNAQAKKLSQLSYIEFINRDLGVMDKTAITLCGEHHLPIIVFDLPGDDNLRRIVMGEAGIGTLVAEEAQLVG